MPETEMLSTPLIFLSDEEYQRCSNDTRFLVEKADAFIRELETVKAQAEAASTEKHQLHLNSIGSNEEIGRMMAEMSEHQKAKRQMMELVDEANRLVELYKERSKKLSKKAGELEGVIQALEAHLRQIENENTEKIEKVISARIELEKFIEKS